MPRSRYLAPIFDRQTDVAALKAAIVRLLRREVYAPLSSAATSDELLSKIDSITPEEVAAKLNTTPAYTQVVRYIDAQFSRSVRTVQNAQTRPVLTLTPKLSKEETQRLKDEYTDNSRLSIVGFLQEMLASLREDVQKSVFAGSRQKALAKRLRAEWGMAERKAEFVARNETSRLSAKLKELRYMSAGVDDYEWRCVSGTAAHPVRHLHRILDGTKQKFSAPPVVNPQGQRKNPGFDWNCRCYARPVVKF